MVHHSKIMAIMVQPPCIPLLLTQKGEGIPRSLRIAPPYAPRRGRTALPLSRPLWIPACAGMTKDDVKITAITSPSRQSWFNPLVFPLLLTQKGEGIPRSLRIAPPYALRRGRTALPLSRPLWIPACVGMTKDDVKITAITSPSRQSWFNPLVFPLSLTQKGEGIPRSLRIAPPYALRRGEIPRSARNDSRHPTLYV